VATKSNLAQQALNNLVNQFARPMDFLRELVQNAIDAGTPRVEVWLKHNSPEAGSREGVLEIHIDDFGEGMDEAIIDEQLTRMFSSTKEDDLTKIGKFGIGFTSIFAINPEAVLLHTGRHGEYWELLFHADRSFDKVCVDRPVQGTRITLLKRMGGQDVEKFIREARWILRYWCEHSDTPVTFWDRTNEQAVEQVDAADPFAAFAAPLEAADPLAAQQPEVATGPEPVTRPLDLEADLFVSLKEDDLDALLGYASHARYGFYNGGLTLLNTRSVDTLGGYGERLGHLSFKVKSDALEHTLTRDNVIQDEHWNKVMTAVLQMARDLQEKLLDRIEQASASGEALGPWLRHLARDCSSDPDIRQIKDFWERVKLRDHNDQVTTLAAVDAQMGKIGTVLLDPGPGPLRDALEAKALILLPDRSELRELLRSAPSDGLFVRTKRTITSADQIFVLPQLIEFSDLPNRERDMMRQCAALIHAAVGRSMTIHVGDYGGPEGGASEALALEGPELGGLFIRPNKGRFRWPLELMTRTLLVNRNHPFYQAQLIAFADEPTLAAYGLAAALLHENGLQRERIFRKLLDAASESVVTA
jgi:hypothetical protein